MKNNIEGNEWWYEYDWAWEEWYWSLPKSGIDTKERLRVEGACFEEEGLDVNQPWIEGVNFLLLYV